MLRRAHQLQASLACSGRGPRLVAARLFSTDSLGSSPAAQPSAAAAAASPPPLLAPPEPAPAPRWPAEAVLHREGGYYSQGGAWATSYGASHVPLSPLQRLGVAVASAVGASLDPSRADLVAALGEATGEGALARMRARMLRSPTGRQLLAEQPRITDATLDAARQAPPGTLGHAYAAFMDVRGFRASERPQVRFVSSPELAYVAQRNREAHDLWHVLFGCRTTVLGELALKALEFVQGWVWQRPLALPVIQRGPKGGCEKPWREGGLMRRCAETGLPMAALSVAGASWRLRPEARTRLVSELLPWALRAGLAADDLMSLYYERHLEDDLEELRARWGIITAPDMRIQVLKVP